MYKRKPSERTGRKVRNLMPDQGYDRPAAVKLTLRGGLFVVIVFPQNHRISY